MDQREEHIERVARAIWDEMPNEASPKAWFGARAIDLDIHEDRLRSYAKGEHECPGSVLLAMFELWGPGFEARVRGVPERAKTIDRAEYAATLRALADKIEAKV